MIIGVTIHKGLTAYSPWFPRMGNAATFAGECIGVSGATNTITIQTKNESDTDSSATDKTPTVALSSAGVQTARVTDLKELVRFKYVVTGTNNYDWIHFRMLPPAWENN